MSYPHSQPGDPRPDDEKEKRRDQTDRQSDGRVQHHRVQPPGELQQDVQIDGVRRCRHIARHAMISFTTLPNTSVSRKSRPW